MTNYSLTTSELGLFFISSPIYPEQCSKPSVVHTGWLIGFRVINCDKYWQFHMIPTYSQYIPNIFPIYSVIKPHIISYNHINQQGLSHSPDTKLVSLIWHLVAGQSLEVCFSVTAWCDRVNNAKWLRWNVALTHDGSMVLRFIYGNIYHQDTPNVSIYSIHGSYGSWSMESTVHVIWLCWKYVEYVEYCTTSNNGSLNQTNSGNTNRSPKLHTL